MAMTLPLTVVEIMAPTTPGRDHPVAEHAPDEQRQHAGCAVFRIAERAGLADAGNDRAHLVGAGGEAEGEDDRHHVGDGQGAQEVSDEDEAPVPQDAADMVTPGRLSISASGARTKTPVRRSKPSK